MCFRVWLLCVLTAGCAVRPTIEDVPAEGDPPKEGDVSTIFGVGRKMVVPHWGPPPPVDAATLSLGFKMIWEHEREM